jgi:hypothetical protein
LVGVWRHVKHNLRRTLLEFCLEISKLIAVAVDESYNVRQGGFGLAAMEDGYLVALFDELAHDERTDEFCAADDEDSHILR